MSSRGNAPGRHLLTSVLRVVVLVYVCGGKFQVAVCGCMDACVFEWLGQKKRNISQLVKPAWAEDCGSGGLYPSHTAGVPACLVSGARAIKSRLHGVRDSTADWVIEVSVLRFPPGVWRQSWG